MNQSTSPYDISDYDAIEAAVSGSDRGRWFLQEFAKRNRVSDTQTVMSAIEKLHTAVSTSLKQPIAPPDVSHMIVETIRNDLMEMAHHIAETHHEIASIGFADSNPQHAALVSGELDAIVQSIELATSEILESAEEIQEIAWTMREGGLAVETCDAIDTRSTKIYLACSFQDLTAQRATKVINTIRFLGNRINKMIGVLQGVEGFGIADSYELNIPPPRQVQPSLEQHNIDFVLGWEGEHTEGDHNWLSESEIEQTLAPLMADTAQKTADIVPLHSSEVTRPSKLNSLDEKGLSDKLNVFT